MMARTSRVGGSLLRQLNVAPRQHSGRGAQVESRYAAPNPWQTSFTSR